MTLIVSREKPILWIGSARHDLAACPKGVRHEIGYALYLAQPGRRHPKAKPLRGFGNASVVEIVSGDRSGAYRAVYTVEFEDAVYGIHVFQKKSRKGITTPGPDMELIRRRLARAREHPDLSLRSP